MPPKRRQPVRATNQSTLSFSSRITKPSALPTHTKAKASRLSPPATSPPAPTIKELAAADVDEKDDFATSSSAESEDETPSISSAPVDAPTPSLPPPASKKPAEVIPEADGARQITEAQLKEYWRKKESSRKAARVHQDDLSLPEKILREFDTTSRYGPSIGITRLARWSRAHRLGLSPPLEVLSALLKELDADSESSALRSNVDRLMGSRFVTES